MERRVSKRRVAGVIGGAMGIGAEVCARVAAAGFAVAVADLDVAATDEAAAGLCRQGSSAIALPLDVAQAKLVGRAYAQVDPEFGCCDVLVNCAGLAKVLAFLDGPLDNFQATRVVNVTGTFLCAQAAARLMLRHGWGPLVNISSVAGLRAVGSGRTAYGTSKGAVIALTRQMAVELAGHRVTANAVCPGRFDTPMTRALDTERLREAYSQGVPMNRYGSTGEIAAAVTPLASEDARGVTGIAMPVDGGFLASGARR